MKTPSPLSLPSVLDTAAGGPLRIALLRAIDDAAPLSIDASAVDRTGLACLQVLVAARAAATSAGLPFAILRPSPALADMAGLAGLGDLLTA